MIEKVMEKKLQVENECMVLKEGGLYIPVHVDGREIAMLVDTGAAHSFMTMDLLRVLGIKWMTSAKQLKVTSALGKEEVTNKRAQIRVQLGTVICKFPVWILEELQVPLIMGWEDQKRFEVHIDAAQERVSLRGQWVKMVQPEEILNPAYALESWLIPGESEVCLPMKVRGVVPGQQVLFQGETSKLLVARSLCAVESVLQEGGIQETCIWMPVVNTEPAEMRLMQGEQVGWTKLFAVSQAELQKAPREKKKIDFGRMEEKAQLAQVDVQIRKKLMELMQEYGEIFSEELKGASQKIPVQHEIILQEKGPVHVQMRRRSPAEEELEEKEVQRLYQWDLIESSVSAWNAPLLLIPKKDGKTRVVVDYRRLNAITKKVHYPLPRIDTMLDTLAGSSVFTVLDACSGYHQIQMNPADKEKTAFSSKSGHHQWKVMPMGLCNAPATYQRVMDCLLRGLKWQYCLIYIDDLIVYSQTSERHLEHLRKVFQVLKEANIKLKLSKCILMQREVCYLGHIISKEGTRPNPKLTEAVQHYPRPKDKHGVKRFLGLVGYYRRFIHHFAHLAKPISKLLRQQEEFKWGDEQEQSFQTLKSRLLDKPVLSFPDFRKPFEIYSDASDNCLGATLEQERKAIAYASRTLQEAEQHYPQHEKECLAAVWAIETFRPYVAGAHFILHTDAISLKWLMSQKLLKGRMARWTIRLQQYDCEIKHIPGEKLPQADALSRINQLTSRALPAEVRMEDVVTGNQLQKLQMNCEEVGRIYKSLVDENYDTEAVKKQWPKLREDFVMENGILHVLPQFSHRIGGLKMKVVIPKALRKELLEVAHQDPLSGHLGVEKTLTRLRESYYWPKMHQDVQKEVQQCAICQQVQAWSKAQPREAMKHIQAGEPFEILCMDYLGGLPETPRGNKYILLFVDAYTRWAEAAATRDESAETVASCLMNLIVCRHGVPQRIHSDQGANFMSELMKCMIAKLGAKQSKTTTYHPQGNGITERCNRSLITLLRKLALNDEGNWDLHLPKALLAYRTAVHNSTMYSPFELVYGRKAKLPLDFLVEKSPTRTSIPEFVQQQQEELKKAAELIRELQEKQQDKVAIGKRQVYGHHQLVWMHQEPVGVGHKLKAKWTGPWEIIEPMGNNVYKIDANGKEKLVNAMRLKPYIHQAEKPRLVEDEAQEPEYEVEMILQHQGEGECLQYLVKWKTYPVEESTWEPATQCHCPQKIADYWNAKKGQKKIAKC